MTNELNTGGGVPNEEAGRVDPDLSVLMALWAGDNSEHFRLALASATVGQTVRPGRLVLTLDGPVTGELASIVETVENGEWGPARVVRSTDHTGLAETLQRGIDACETEFIARADADDINHPERFERQLAAMREEHLDIVGSHVRELLTTPHGDSAPGQVRYRPLEHGDIIRYLRDHSPFHHPTVMMRKSALVAAGGYRHFDYMEDYDLWHRMLQAGARAGNIDEVLVDYRVSERLYERRGGWTLFSSDIRLQRELLAAGTTTPLRATRNLAGRAAYRLVPTPLRKHLYWRIIENGSLGRSAHDRTV